MNIWIINHYAMPPEYEVRVRTIMMAKYLQEAGHKVKIFCASTIHNTDINLIDKKGPLYIEKNYDGLNYVHIKTSGYSGNGFSRMKNMLEFPVRLIKVSKQISINPNIIVCDLGAMLAPLLFYVSKLKKAKFILEVRDLWPESIIEYKKISRKNPIVKIMYVIEKWVYKKSDKLIFTMEGGRDYIADKGWDKEIDSSKVYHINNGVDLETFNENKKNYTLKDEDLDDDTTFKVVYAGSIRLANNVEKIVEAAKIIQESKYESIKFIIYGDGSDRLPLEKFCVDNNIRNIEFKGQIDKRLVPYVLSKSDVNILHFEQNSLKKYGGSLNKMFEYFASGKPTVSDCEFGYDLINRYKAGISIDVIESKQFSDIIIKFYNMEETEYNEYCENALKAANEFDYKILINRFNSIISN
ncbi:MAG: glycosyltransferase family 4 protein [Lachnotalea sp.]